MKRKSFLKQVVPLLVSLAIVGGLSLMVRTFEREAPRPFDRLIVEVLPELPDLTGRSSELIERLEEAHGDLQIGERQRDALVELAYLYHANGFFLQAESCYLGLESFEIENPQWPYLLGLLKRDRRDQAEVATHFARAIQLDPTHSLSYYRLGDAYRKGGQLDDAKTSYEYRLIGSPRDGWARLGLGQVAMLENEWEAARDWLEQARERMPEIGQVHELLPEVYVELGNIEAAKQARGEADPRRQVFEPRDERLSFMSAYSYDPYRVLELAREARAAGEVEQALELLERALQVGAEDQSVVEEVSNLIQKLEESSAAAAPLM